MTTKKRKHVSRVHCRRAPSQFLAALLEAVAAMGLDAAAILRRCNAGFSLADLYAEAPLDLPIDVFTSVNRRCNRVLRDYLARIGDGMQMDEEQFTLHCHCLINTGTLGQAVAVTARFFRMFEGRIGDVIQQPQGDQVVLQFNPIRTQRSAAGLVVDAYGLAVMQMLYGWLIDQPVKLTAVQLAYPRPDRNALCLSLFDCEIEFDQVANSLVFPAQYLSQPIVRNHVELTELLRSFPYDLMLASYHQKPLYEQVYLVMMNHYSSRHLLPTIDDIAATFSMTSSTLRRRLAEEDTAYSKIRRDCQLRLAADFLRRAELTVDEIAHRSSFSDPTTFRRAFRHWTGKSPSAYRAELLGARDARLASSRC
jgi:AraC-like DNA-binding protein